LVTVNDAVINLADRVAAIKRLQCVRLVDQKFDQMFADQYNFIDNLRFARLAAMPTVAPLPVHKPLPTFLERFAIDCMVPVRLLSGGQRQILAILMALQQPVEVLLLDEPTAALDEKNAIMLMDFIHQLAADSGITVLIICHDQSLVDRYAAGEFHKLCHQRNSMVRQLVRHRKMA
jgi:ABC-type lipoprotein export system ATPase subunit